MASAEGSNEHVPPVAGDRMGECCLGGSKQLQVLFWQIQSFFMVFDERTEV